MVATYCMRYIKIIHCLCGVVLWAMGIVCAVLPVWMRFSSPSLSYIEFLLSNPDSEMIYTDYVGIAIIAIGSAIIIVVFIGLCAVVVENKPLLITYCVLMFILALALIAVAVLMYFLVYDDLMMGWISKDMKWSVETYNTSDGSTDFDTSLDDFQQGLSCCGSYSYEVWDTLQKSTPDSCYSDDNSIFTTGCEDMVFDFIQYRLMILMFLSCGSAGLIMLFLVISCVLSTGIDHVYIGPRR